MKFIIKKMVLVASFSLLLGLCNQVMANSETKPEAKIAYAINLGDITEMNEDAIYSAISEVFSTIVNDVATEELTCTVTVTGSVTIGVAKIEIEISVSGPCSEVKAKGKQLAKEIMEDIKKELMS